MAKSKQNTEQRKKILKERSKNAMRKLRERIKNDPVLHEEEKRKARERYKARKEAGKVKTIADLSERERRKVRKCWREKSKKAYHSKKERENLLTRLNEFTPPSTPVPEEFAAVINITPQPSPQPGPSRQSLKGKQILRRNRENMKKEIEILKTKLDRACKRASKYKKRYVRLRKKNPNTPNKNVRELLNGQKVTPEVKRKLITGEVLQLQLKKNFKDQETIMDKQRFVNSISGDIVKKYRCENLVTSVSSRKILKNKNISPKLKQDRARFLRLKEVILSFFEKDEVSRLCPGKKDTVTFRKTKKQKRYLNDSLKNIFSLFKTEHPEVKMSYFRFCRFRPFWVKFPTAKSRETCLCIIHENMSLLVRKLKTLNIINAASSTDIVKEICCDFNNEDCLGRLCLTCANREIQFRNVDDSIIVYKKWISKKVEILVKGEKKFCQKTVKEDVESTKENIVSTFKQAMPHFLKHLLNIRHQYNSVEKIKINLGENEVLIHMDFSENYLCKYGREIQSAHFGGSKPQISLHTVMVYTKNEKTSMCTFSENLRHDPFAICAHLGPVAEFVKTLIPNLCTVHFLSDGPATQYKNKTMFFLIAAYLSKIFTCDAIRWHYSESGHGKGAPDGIGGCLKRIADNLVAQGKDLNNFDSLIRQLQENCKGIACYTISGSEITQIENDTSVPVLKPFKGTMTIREIVWIKSSSNLLKARTLSCLTCGIQECCHFEIGIISIPSLSPPHNLNEIQEQIQFSECILLILFFSIFFLFLSCIFCSIFCIGLYNIFLTHSLVLPGTSGLQNINKDVKIPERVHYRDVYSSDSSSDEMTLDKLKKTLKEDKTECSIDPKVNDFVIVRLISKKCSKYFVGLVLNIDKHLNFTVKFLKKIHENKFVFPEKDDISIIDLDEIVSILNLPNLNKREQYIFSSFPSNFYIS